MRPVVFLFVCILWVLGNNCLKQELGASDEYSVPNHFLEEGPYFVIFVDVLGLANRLRTISGFYAMAISRKATLIVLWQGSEECPVRFDDLFPSFELSNFHVWYTDRVISSGQVIPLLNSIAYEDKRSIQHVYPKAFLIPSVAYKEADVTVLWTRGSHAPADIECAAYLTLKNQFYRGLRPAPEVLNIVNHVLSEVIGINIDDSSSSGGGGRSGRSGVPLLVGVHIREHDERYDWAVVTPSKIEILATNTTTITTTTTTAGILTTTESLASEEVSGPESRKSVAQSFSGIKVAHDVVKAITAVLDSEPKARIYLASNSKEAKQAITNEFSPGSIVTIYSDLNDDRSTKNGMLMALADFIVLGHSDVILHSRGSSFAREAAMWLSPATTVVVDIADTVKNDIKENNVQAEAVKDTSSREGTSPPSFSSSTLSSLSSSFMFYSLDSTQDLCAMPEYIREAVPLLGKQPQQQDEQENDDDVDIGDIHAYYGAAARSHTVVSGASSRGKENTRMSDLICYSEGESREMCTKVYKVCPCTNQHGHSTATATAAATATKAMNVLCYEGLISVYLNLSAATALGSDDYYYKMSDVDIWSTRCQAVMAESNGYSL